MKEQLNKTIHLTMPGGYDVLLDQEDYQRICKYIKESGSNADPAKWQATYNIIEKEPRVYASKTIGGRGAKKWRMHRLIFALRGYDIEDCEIDHRNSEETLDNRFVNLRIATSSQNKVNRKARRDNKLGMKGVEQLPSGRYAAYIVNKGKKTHLGVFDTVDEAGAAYNRKAIELWGEYALTNRVSKRTIKT